MCRDRGVSGGGCVGPFVSSTTLSGLRNTEWMSDAPSKRSQKMCDIRFAQGERRRDEFLAAIRAGATIDDALTRVGWTSASTYRQNRRRHRWWACCVDYERTVATTGNSREGWRGPSPQSKWPFLRYLWS
jgi:hypothetical protein